MQRTNATRWHANSTARVAALEPLVADDGTALCAAGATFPRSVDAEPRGGREAGVGVRLVIAAAHGGLDLRAGAGPCFTGSGSSTLSLGIFAIEATTAIGVDGTGQPSDERQLGFLGNTLLVALSVIRPAGPVGSRRRYTTDHREPEQPGPSINLVHIFPTFSVTTHPGDT